MNKKLLGLAVGSLAVGAVSYAVGYLAGTTAFNYLQKKNDKLVNVSINDAYNSLVYLKCRIPTKMKRIDSSNKLNIDWFDDDCVLAINNIYELDGIQEFSEDDQMKLNQLLICLKDIIEIDKELISFTSVDDYREARNILKKYAFAIASTEKFVDTISV